MVRRGCFLAENTAGHLYQHPENKKASAPGQGRRPCELRGTTLIQQRMTHPIRLPLIRSVTWTMRDLLPPGLHKSSSEASSAAYRLVCTIHQLSQFGQLCLLLLITAIPTLFLFFRIQYR